MTEWNAATYKEYMQKNHLVESRAVKSFVLEAAKQMRWVKIYSDYMNDDPNPVTLNFMEKADKDRQEAIKMALWTAMEEKKQGWQFLENGQEYVNTLMLKYQGDLTKCTDEERLTEQFIDELDQQSRRQSKQVSKQISRKKEKIA
ncbi:hypothetical protein [Secundilactobacillus yichangensis]|uniref:hypothetical protein n=1 Tax=Secundilactobacillus yichangensis TaxID=2799580 RepID=UPI0019458077|nr:hypothetical protein [Secundilactobacillus yichangensis]